QFAAQAAYDGFYTSTPVPNPDLVALGAKFATADDFILTEFRTFFWHLLLASRSTIIRFRASFETFLRQS
ncbi:hypothetical protein R3P38DRAFT_2545188, partial [Favolaschia claudopus]